MVLIIALPASHFDHDHVAYICHTLFWVTNLEDKTMGSHASVSSLTVMGRCISGGACAVCLCMNVIALVTCVCSNQIG